MGWWFSHHKQQPNEVLVSRTLREMAETCDWTKQIRVSPPLAMTATANGPLITYPGMIFESYVAVVASGGISVRSSSTPGSGQVTLQTWNGSTLANYPGSLTVTAYNISSSATIASGKYCIVMKISGVYWIITAEC